MKVIVTIPAFNEEKTIGKVIHDVKKVMDRAKYKYEILVVNDGSTDKTVEIAKREGAKVHSHPYNYGLSETFRTEIEKSLKKNADIIVHIDADGQYNAFDIPRLIEPIIKNKADLVLGSRFLGKIEKMSIMKRIGNKVFSKVISNITKVKITDAQTGFRAFTKDVAGKIKIISDHTYTQEMIIKAIREKFRIKEVPVYFYKRDSGKSRLLSNPFEYALKAWTNIFRIYRDYDPLKFFGFIGSSLISVSLLLGLFILYIFIIAGTAGTYQKLPTILLSIVLFVTGIQILIFGFLADEIKKN